MMGSGHLAPLWITVYGLSADELSPTECPSGILILEVPGLCIGGGVDPRHKEIGYICFIRSDGPNDVEAERFGLYHDMCFLPFVRTLRELYNGESTGQVPDEQTVVSWFDGDRAQLAARTKEGRLDSDFEVDKVADVKQNNGRTGVEQGCDLSTMFMILSVSVMYLSKNMSCACALHLSYTS
jgi:hypothetical protein